MGAAGAIGDLFELGALNSLGLRTVEGRTPEPREKWTALNWKTIRGDYLQAIGVPLLRGRYFTAQDSAASPLVAIIDESAARATGLAKIRSASDSKDKTHAAAMTTG